MSSEDATLRAETVPRTEPASVPQGAKYRRDVDGLRAVAVLAVLVYHAFPERLPGGFVGVDVFFVISGFLITGILLGDLGRGDFSLASFYARRVRRIFPALAVVLAASCAFGWIALFPDEYRQLGRHVVAGAAFFSNFILWGEAGYFDNAAETKPLLHLWSLGIEEQFYIAWPLLLFAAHRLRLGVFRFLPWLAAASFLWSLALVGERPVAAFYSPASRAWELALGGLLAAVAARRPELPPRRGTPLATAGLILLALGFVLVDAERRFPGGWALLPTLGTLALLAAGPGAAPNRTLLASRPMVWVGLISYPLYLWHWPLLAFARVVESKTPPLGWRMAALALSFALAAATWRWIERPFRSGGASRRKVATLVAAMTAVAAAGLAIALREGLPGRAAVRAQAELQRALVMPDDPARAEACRRRFGFTDPSQYCWLDDPAAPPTVALVGDSHGRHLVEGLSARFRSEGGNLLYLATRLPIWDSPAMRDEPVQRITGRMLDVALATPSVGTVIVSTKLKLVNRSPEGRRITAAFRATLERYVASGRRVILVRDVPRLDFDPRECIGRIAIPTSTTRSPCAMPRATFEAATARHDRALAALLDELPRVELLDAPRLLCDDRLCWAMLDGRLLYRDSDHLSRDGDLWVGERFEAGLLDAAAFRRELEARDPADSAPPARRRRPSRGRNDPSPDGSR